MLINNLKNTTIMNLELEIAQDRHDSADMHAAMNEAVYALEAASLLSKAMLQTTPLDEKALDVAVETYIDYFQYPQAALEDGEGTNITASAGEKLKKVIIYIYSLAQKLISYFVSFLTNKKLAASRYAKLAKNVLGRVDGFKDTTPSSTIDNRSTIASVCINGKIPNDVVAAYTELLKKYEVQKSHTVINEASTLVRSAKIADPKTTIEASVKLHKALLAGAQASFKEDTDPKANIFFKESNPLINYFIDGPYFGQKYVIIQTSKEPAEGGVFTYTCKVVQNNTVPVRAMQVNALSPNNITALCRVIINHCSSVTDNAGDEQALQKIFRDAKFLTTNNPTSSSVTALSNFTNIVKNSYAAYLEMSMSITRDLLSFANASATKYEKLDKSEPGSSSAA
jgi:hypothetical protein